MKKLFKLGLLAAVVGAIYKMVSTQKEEWKDLSEPEVRGKLHDKLGTKVPEDKLEQIGDKVVGKMRETGRLRDDPAEA
jgi:hypothetical protein